MPVGIIQPSNQIKLTNVSLVRIKKGKKRFEIACYKNKVLEWRSGIEKDLDNVIQIPNVFTNVSKGQVAPKADLVKAFGDKATVDDIVLEILTKGELQVGDKERQAQLDRVHHEVVDIVAGKLVDPKTKRVYTTGMIEKALDQLSSQSAHQQAELKAETKAEGADAVEDEDKGKAKELPKWTGVVTTKSAKSQALDAMKALIAHQPIPVARMQMQLRITCPPGILKQSVKSTHVTPTAEGDDKPRGTVKDMILSFVEQVMSQDVVGDQWEVVGLVEPGSFKPLNEFLDTHTKGRGSAEVLDMAVGNEDD
ncbi:Shwachman-Bodian-diamond syndrome protein [Amniculicola lignicola CBS 123094]|uniref:Ribosome maturation protein SDO1 n=1 Tax=Amniculicola lignicola CBS 123094 TaxID=1392246 RepID=A0A6A5WBT8_9PLEO|nr:Shwachman-Bodian-diamond syndrome protein [Amniculicola lignicola CBS 123094]